MYIHGTENSGITQPAMDDTEKLMNSTKLEREFMLALAADDARMGVLQNETRSAIKRSEALKI